MRHGFFQQLGRDRRGVSVVELALVAPVLAMMLLGMVDASLLVQRQLELQEATAQLANIAAASIPTATNLSDFRVVGARLADVPEERVTLSLGIRCNSGAIQPTSAACNTGEQRSTILSIRLTDQFSSNHGGVGFLPTINLRVAREVQVA